MYLLYLQSIRSMIRKQRSIGGILSKDARFNIYPHVYSPLHPPAPSVKVCLCTQLSLNRISSLPRILKSWEGPLSVTVYITNKESATLTKIVKYLNKCFPHAQSRMSIHVVTSRKDIFVKGPTNFDLSLLDCKYPITTIDRIIHEENKLIDDPIIEYPQNIFRNLARRGCRTPFSVTIDCDLIPSLNLFQNLNKFLTRNKIITNTLWVIPAFELRRTSLYQIPGNIPALLRYLQNRKARVFHVTVTFLECFLYLFWNNDLLNYVFSFKNLSMDHGKKFVLYNMIKSCDQQSLRSFLSS